MISVGDCASASEREVADVGEHDRRPQVPAAERKARLLEVVRHLCGCEAPHQLPLLVTQLLLGEPRADAGAQEHRVDWLAQIVLRAELDAANDVLQSLDGRRDDDGHVAQVRVGDDLFEDLEAVHLRHLDVEQDEVEGLAPQPVEGDPSVLGKLDAMALRLDAAGEQEPVHLVVVDNEQSRAAFSHAPGH